MTRDEALDRIADFLYRHYESDRPGVTGVLPSSVELDATPEVELQERELHLRYTLLRKTGGPASTTLQIYSLDELLEMICDD
jgi:hypothetical protein